MNSYRELETQTQAVYEANAVAFDAQRNKSLFEQNWLDRFLSHLTPGDAILDVGCGTGEPIAKYFIDKGHRVTGVDFAPSMLRIANHRYPNETWLLQDMRQLKLHQRFKGILSWGAFFHLPYKDQARVLTRFNQLLHPGGVLLITVGHEKGEIRGTVNGQPVYHASLSLNEYEAILQSQQLTILDFALQDPACQGHSVLLAKKIPPTG